MGGDITVLIPHIPTRGSELLRAVKSVETQTHAADVVTIVTDVKREGSAMTRNRGLRGLTTEWVAFLDDDDEFMPHHLKTLSHAVIETDADVVYSGCLPIGPDGREITRRTEWGRFGRSFDPILLRYTSYLPVTSLVKTELARRVYFGPPKTHPGSNYDDWGFYLRLLSVNARFHHVPEVTWVWHHHGANTSGRPDRW